MSVVHIHMTSKDRNDNIKMSVSYSHWYREIKVTVYVIYQKKKNKATIILHIKYLFDGSEIVNCHF